jgi:hypothetical protein
MLVNTHWLGVVGRSPSRMLGFFKSSSFVDPLLGELHRSRGAWRGTLKLDLEAPVPLVVSGGRTAPDAEALRIARSVPSNYASWRPTIERELFDHYSPYAEAVAAGELDVPSSALPPIDAPSSVWFHTTLAFVQVTPLSGVLTVEIGYRVAWDEEHTLAARFRGGQLLELCGSVLAP